MRGISCEKKISNCVAQKVGESTEKKLRRNTQIEYLYDELNVDATSIINYNRVIIYNL